MAQAANPYDAPKTAVAEAAGETQPVKLFSVAGRIGRVRYIAYGIGFYFLIATIGGILAAVLGDAAIVAVVLIWVALLAVVFMLTIQRCHDFNSSGWLSLLALIPLVNLIFWFIPGTDGPNRYGAPTPPNSVGAIVVVCVVPVLVFIVGVLAAIAVPAYQDYTHRARVTEVILSATPWREAVAEHYAQTGKLPAGAADLRKGAVPPGDGKWGRVSLGADGVLTLTLSAQTGAIADKTIEMRAQTAGGTIVSWDCKGGTLPLRNRPPSCRAQ